MAAVNLKEEERLSESLYSKTCQGNKEKDVGINA